MEQHLQLQELQLIMQEEEEVVVKMVVEVQVAQAD